MQTLLEILDDAAIRYGDRPALGLRADDGSAEQWSFRELTRRSKAAAWRLRQAGMESGQRLLTWSPSMPELPAVYFGAMRAGVVIVPLDLRMAPEAIERISAKAEPTRLAVGTGRDAPDPESAHLEALPRSTVEELAAQPDPSWPADWERQVEGWPKPALTDLAEIIFTSGTTGTPKGVMLTQANISASVEAAHRIIAPQEHRVVSLLPLSHLLEQVSALYYAISVGADILYVRSRNPRVIFEAIRGHRVTTMVVVPQVLDLFWTAIEREVEKAGRTRTFNQLRRLARHLPYRARRVLFRRVHAQLGGSLNLFVCAGAFLPPALQLAWEDLGVVVMQGYGATECGPASCTSRSDHALGTVGKPIEGFQVKLAADGEILMKGPSLFQGYWRDPEATASALTPDGWYRTGDIGRFDAAGHLILMGRTKDIIVLPNGLNVYPEDMENALRVAGVRDSVVLETAPGRIEAVILQPEGTTTTAVSAAVKAANATLAIHQRVAAWRPWPEADFPRTHTLKVKRDQVRAWAAVEQPLPVHEGREAVVTR